MVGREEIDSCIDVDVGIDNNGIGDDNDVGSVGGTGNGVAFGVAFLLRRLVLVVSFEGVVCFVRLLCIGTS